MKRLNQLSTFLGWLFVLLTALVLTRPGGLLRVEFLEWWKDRAIRTLIVRDWEELSRGALTLGSSGTSAQLVEFVDYQCGYCRLFHGSLSAYLDANSDVSVAIRFKILGNNPVSREAAAAAICAAQQERFPALHDYFMTDTTWIRSLDWEGAGRRAGVENLEAWTRCRGSPAVSAALATDSLWAERLSLDGTPGFVRKSGRVHLGAVPISEFAEWVR